MRRVFERVEGPDPELQSLVSMLEYFEKEGGKYAPSGFWDSLDRLHVRDLLAGNYPLFKRTLAFQYFTWLPSLTDVQVRNLAPNSSRVAELGAGYGRLAYVFLKSEMCKQYVIADIPPALYVSQRYLRVVFPELRFFRFRPFEDFSEVADEFESSKVCFLTPDQLEHLPAKYFDLFITISSLQEMKMELVSLYISLIDRLTGGYCYVKQWREWHNPVDDLTVGYRDYPIPLSWRRIFARRHAVQSGMFEALWEVPRRGGGG